MKSRVLWVEDDARFGLAQLAGPVYVHGGYDLVVASDVSTAIARLSRENFDAVIVDIRLPPGEDRAWIELYGRERRNKVRARLGLQLLYSLLGHPGARVHLKQRPGWLAPGKLGVFTVESRSEIEEDLKALGVRVYEQKRADLPDTVLLDIIKEILKPQAPLHKEGKGG